jgi:hypothetical protein
VQVHLTGKDCVGGEVAVQPPDPSHRSVINRRQLSSHEPPPSTSRTVNVRSPSSLTVSPSSLTVVTHRRHSPSSLTINTPVDTPVDTHVDTHVNTHINTHYHAYQHTFLFVLRLHGTRILLRREGCRTSNYPRELVMRHPIAEKFSLKLCDFD